MKIVRLERAVTLSSAARKRYNMKQHEKKTKKIATVHHEKTFNMKRMQYGKRCNMTSVTRTELVQLEKCATRKKSNMKKLERGKSATRKECSTKKEQHEKSSI